MAKEVYVKAVMRKEPDLRKLARVLIQLALAEEHPKQEGGGPKEAA